MIAIVQPDADDLARIGHRRQQPDVRRIVPDDPPRQRLPGPALPLAARAPAARARVAGISGSAALTSTYSPPETPQALGPSSVATVTQRICSRLSPRPAAVAVGHSPTTNVPREPM